MNVPNTPKYLQQWNRVPVLWQPFSELAARGGSTTTPPTHPTVPAGESKTAEWLGEGRNWAGRGRNGGREAAGRVVSEATAHA